MQNNPYSQLSPFVFRENAFTAAEADAIVAMGDRLRLEKATTTYQQGNVVGDDPIRVTRTAWMARDAQTNWIYDRMERIARTLNHEIYRFDLTGFSDLFQYTVYHGEEGGHFGWHIDQISQPALRKLSFSVQLSDPSDYEGCDLEIHAGTRIDKVTRAKGAVVAFPAYVMHRVTPIRSGTRKALVCWTAGPAFR
jgi:predicted 2-oxoglutarate/Fe(II)-dependent dioxygenase YbiX